MMVRGPYPASRAFRKKEGKTVKNDVGYDPGNDSIRNAAYRNIGQEFSRTNGKDELVSKGDDNER